MSYLKCSNLLRRNATKYYNFMSTLYVPVNRFHVKFQISGNIESHFKFPRFTPLSFSVIRAMSSEGIKNIEIKDYVRLREDPNISIIDVREKSEIAETGILPGGINIPLGEIPDALQKDAAAFEKLYKKGKPTENDQIIFSCRSGKRSMMAAETATKLGFKNVMNLTGGWLAWEEYSKGK